MFSTLKIIPVTIRTSLLWIFVLIVIGVQGGDYFDCHRDGQDCANNKSCVEEGVNAGNCDCDGTDYSGYDCGLTEALKNSGPCTSLTDYCGTDGGICYDNDGTAACYCPEWLYGDQCEKKRFEVTCSDSSMLIVMNPFGSFSGIIYVNGQDSADCTFSTTDLPNDRQGLALNVLDADCGGVTVNSATNRSRDVIVQHNKKYLTSVDSKVKVTCGEGTSTVDVQTEFNSETLEGNIKDQSIDNTLVIESSIIRFDVKLKDGTVITSTVPLDNQLTFEFTTNPVSTTCTFAEYTDMTGDSNNFVSLQENKNKEQCQELCGSDVLCVAVEHDGNNCGSFNVSQVTTLTEKTGSTYMEKACVQTGYEAIRIESCIASNKQTGSDLETLSIIEHGCPSAEIGKLMKQKPTRLSATNVAFKLKPFKFNKDAAISVSCTIKVCPVTKGTFCDAVNCESGSRRRKRSRDFSDVMVEKTFTVGGPSELKTEISETSNDVCDPEVNLTTPIIAGVSIVTFLMLLACLLVLVLLKKKRADRKCRKESVYNGEREFRRSRMYPFVVSKY